MSPAINANRSCESSISGINHYPATEALERVQLMMKLQMLNITDGSTTPKFGEDQRRKRRLDMILATDEDSMRSWDDVLYCCDNDGYSSEDYPGDMEVSSSSDDSYDDIDESINVPTRAGSLSYSRMLQRPMKRRVRSSFTKKGLVRSKSIGREMDSLPVEQSLLCHQFQFNHCHPHHQPCLQHLSIVPGNFWTTSKPSKI